MTAEPHLAHDTADAIKCNTEQACERAEIPREKQQQSKRSHRQLFGKKQHAPCITGWFIAQIKLALMKMMMSLSRHVCAAVQSPYFFGFLEGYSGCRQGGGVQKQAGSNAKRT